MATKTPPLKPLAQGAPLAALAALTVTLLAAAPATGQMTPFGVSLQRKGFEKIDYRHGVTVFKHRTSSLINIAAEGKLKAPPEVVQRVLLAYSRQPGRIGRLSEARVLRRSRKSLLVYQRLNLPIIDDRDFTLEVRWGKRGHVRWIRFRAVRRGPAKRGGVVRVTHHIGSWQLKPMGAGHATWARFETQIDLAGWLPRWMARSKAGREVPQVFVQFNKLIATERARAAHRRKPCTSNCS